MSLLGSTVPTKTGLNWFMPALANNRVGSSRGMVDEEWTYKWSFLSVKNLMKHSRIWEAVNEESMAQNQANPKDQ